MKAIEKIEGFLPSKTPRKFTFDVYQQGQIRIPLFLINELPNRGSIMTLIDRINALPYSLMEDDIRIQKLCDKMVAGLSRLLSNHKVDQFKLTLYSDNSIRIVAVENRPGHLPLFNLIGLK